MEKAVPLVGMPPSMARARILRRVLAAPAPPARSVAGGWGSFARLTPWGWWHRQDARWRAVAAGSLAASLLFVALVVMLWGPDRSLPPAAAKRKPAADPFLTKLMERDLRLATARTPRDRLEILADMADDLQGQTRVAARSAEAEDLGRLAALYERVLREGLLAGARKLPPNQRNLLDAIAVRLTRFGVEAERLAAELTAAPSEALRQIAAASRETDEQLRALARGQSS
jgi:hypothetical protein